MQMAQCEASAAHRLEFNLQMQEIRQQKQQQKQAQRYFLPCRRQIDFCKEKYACEERRKKNAAPKGGSVKNYALKIDFPATVQNRKRKKVEKTHLSAMELTLGLSKANPSVMSRLQLIKFFLPRPLLAAQV